MKLRYTLRGAAELDEVLTDLARKSPRGARHVQMRIRDIIDLLSRHPNAGQLTSKGRLRRLGAYPYPYLIFYRATDDEGGRVLRRANDRMGAIPEPADTGSWESNGPASSCTGLTRASKRALL